MPKKLEVIFIGAEASPLAKVGGLGDVVGSLPVALQSVGVKVKLILPFYASIDKRQYKTKLVAERVSLRLDGKNIYFSLHKTVLPHSKVEVFLIKNKLFDGKDIYVGDKKSPGDLDRYVFFSKAAVEAIRYLQWRPDVVHAHDWHAGLVPTFLDEYSLQHEDFRNIKSIYTIHNLANQGISDLNLLKYASLSPDKTPALMEDYYDLDGGVIDIMKVAILSADVISTVSPNYAREILTPMYGEGMEKYLRRRSKNLLGILNGIDYDFFDPQKDRLIKYRYKLANYREGKQHNKKYLQKKLSLTESASLPLFSLVTRLVGQKGLDLLLPALEDYFETSDGQLVILGSGEARYEAMLGDMAKKYPKRMHVRLGFDAKLAQQIYASADFFLMPSLFEPCGLGQMIACRYGTIPIVRDTGGLHDTVKNGKNGIVFKDYNIASLTKSLIRADKIFRNAKAMEKMIKAGMQTDFSWIQSAKKYKKLYERLQ